MRVCMVAYTFYETDNRVRRYAETLARRGDQVDVIVLRRPTQTSFDVIRRVNVFRIQQRVVDESSPVTYLLKLLAFFVRSSWTLTRHHLRHKYDVIHVHSVPDFEVFSTVLPRLLGAKIILDIHDIVPELYASKFKIAETSVIYRLLLWMEKLSVRYSHHVIVANHLWFERLLRRSARPGRTTAILNYPDPTLFASHQRALQPAGKDFVLCYPGTLSHHQGVDLIIAAIDRLRDRLPNIKLQIFGDGPERARLDAMVANLDLGDRVTIGAGVALERVAEAMHSVDLGIEPKRKRSFGNEALSTKIFEFMAMGVPVLASDTRINQLYFGDGLVEFFTSDDVDDLANGIARLLRDAPARSRLSERGLDYIESNNWNVKRDEYLNLVDRLVSPGGKEISPRDRSIATIPDLP